MVNEAEIDVMTEAEEIAPITEENSSGEDSPVQNENEDTLENVEDTTLPGTIEDAPDYDEIAREDVAELKKNFPELRNLSDLTELKNPLRYAALRDLGLSATEAYLATGGRAPTYDNRAHLTPSVPSGASLSREMSRGDYDMAKEIFSDLSDAEIRKLYRKVTK